MHRGILFIFLFGFLVKPSLSQVSAIDLGKSSWQFKKETDSVWRTATVPGTIHTDLMAHHLIPDPFFADQESQVQWVEEATWHYRTTFPTPAKKDNSRVILEFQGLDTYAEVWLNDSCILHAENMFRTWSIDVSDLLSKNSNVLLVVFHPAAARGKMAAEKLPYHLPGDERLFTRKAQYQYGWDWGPRLVTCGIWKPVALKIVNEARIEHIHYDQKILQDSLAEITFYAEILATRTLNDIHLVASVDTPANAGNQQTVSVTTLTKGSNVLKITFCLRDPKRWFCRGLGPAHQYAFRFALYHGYSKLDERAMALGIRTIELIRENDSAGTGFYFRVNGIPVFAKGANVIPPDNFLPRAGKQVYENIVKDACEANMNMLRVWGGGVYGEDAFYAACDREGILVWQDFMYACAMYPEESLLSENVRTEITQQIKRLQNHPSLALWCGNNEISEGWDNWGWQKQYGYSPMDSVVIFRDYHRLFFDLLPALIRENDPLRKQSYWPSSPSLGWGRKESYTQGDVHYWGVWWGMEPFESYNNHVGRFVSEYGFQGIPGIHSLKRMLPASSLRISSPSLRNHQKHPRGFETIQTYMERDLPVPESLEDYAYVSQILQAQGLKTAIEAHRRNRPYCMGSLLWQMNDCWPVISWSLTDHYGERKAAFYQVKRSFSDTWISTEETDTSVRIFLLNDNHMDLKGPLRVGLMDFYGKESFSFTKICSISAGHATCVAEVLKRDLPGLLKEKQVLRISFRNKETGPEILHYFEKPRNLDLPPANVSLTWISSKEVELTSDVHATHVWLSSPIPGIHWNDNDVDLVPGQPIRIKSDHAFKPAERNRVTLRSLNAIAK